MSLMDDWDDSGPSYAPAAAGRYDDPVHEEQPTAADDDGIGAIYESANAEIEDVADEEMFQLEKLDQNFFESYGGIKLAICRGDVFIMATGTETNSLIQFNVRTQEIAELEMPRSDCSISGIFADEGGRHCLIVANTSTDVLVFYLQPSFKKPKQLSKLKGLRISAVGWDNTNKSDASTKPILLGTADGHFFETCITKGREDYSKQLYSLKDDRMEGHPISGLDVQKLSDRVFFILASTSTRFYEFHGGACAAPLRSVASMDGRRVGLGQAELPTVCCHSVPRSWHQISGLLTPPSSLVRL
eukprot:SAG11_NODE_3906_length_2156_cov_1.129315_2_plen_301_part_00